MNTKNKGQRKETLCANELKKDGYFIAFKACTVRRGPFFVGLDFGDTFDVVGIKRVPIYGSVTDELLGYSPHWKFVSCSFVSHRAEKIAAVVKFKEDFGIRDTMPKNGKMDFEVWLWTPARYRGRGKNKHFEQAKWEKIVV